MVYFMDTPKIKMDENWGHPIVGNFYIHSITYMYIYNNRRKFRSQTSHNEKSQREEKKREDQRRERVGRQKMQVREKVEKSRNTSKH